MVLSAAELISALQNEVRILLHLAGKVEPRMLDYRPTPTQRSTLELLQYLAIMGPTQIAVIKNGIFDRPSLSAAWSPAEAAAKKMSFDQAVAANAALREAYAQLSTWSDADFRFEIDMFGSKSSRGAMLVNQVLAGHAAYRTQLFCYLKSCGLDALGTVNLWAGVDRMAAP